MGRYVARRLLQAIPVFFGATFIVFAMVYAIPGDPIRALNGERPISESAQAALREQYNLDDPLPIQYLKYVGLYPDEQDGFNGLLQGNFGTTFRGYPVSEIMKEKIPVTARLAVGAFIVETIIGLTLGLLAGLKRGSLMDNGVLVMTTIVVAVPTFVLGFVSQIIFGVQLGWFPIAGIQDGWMSYVMPSFVLATASLVYIARLTRTSLVENLRSDYIRTAQAKGLSRSRVVGRHALRNSLIPVVTFLAVDLGALLGGAIITEGIFNIPGIGREVFLAIRGQEGAVVVGIVTFGILVFIIANLIVDILYAVLDPRIRLD
jgi:peptide/nickel transport system permease protein/oligopeptide transport system permease protein